LMKCWRLPLRMCAQLIPQRRMSLRHHHSGHPSRLHRAFRQA